MKFFKNVLWIAILNGCGTKHASVESSIFLSPCIDGTILNMSAGGCDEFNVSPSTEGYMELACTSARTAGFWTATKFRAYPVDSEVLVPEGWHVHCVDHRTVMFIAPK